MSLKLMDVSILSDKHLVMVIHVGLCLIKEIASIVRNASEKIVNFENAKHLKVLGYNKPTPHFYYRDGSIGQSYAIDISSELLWYVPTFDDVNEWLKNQFGFGIGMTPSLWDIDLGKEVDKSKLSWFFRSGKYDIVKDGCSYSDAFNNGLSKLLDKIEEDVKKAIQQNTGYIKP